LRNSFLLRSLRPACSFRVIEQPNRGRILARNAAFQAAEGELLLILDDDIVCPPSLLAEHVAAHNSCDRLVTFGANAVSDESPQTFFTDWARAAFAEWRAELERDSTPKWPYHATLDANFSLPHAIINEFGGYDTRFLTREIELGLRLWRAGVRFQFLPRATAYHIYDKGDDMVRVDAEPYGREEVLLCRLHPEYRPVSALAGIEQVSAVRRYVRSWLARAPFHPDLLLRPLFQVASSMRQVPAAKRVALRILGLRQSTTMLRGALREADSWSAYCREFIRRLPALAYHHVGLRRPETHPGLTVSPEHFEQHLRLLLYCGYTPITAEQWYEWIRHGLGLPDRPVLISFDDSYADLADYALPILKKYGCTALVFVVTGLLGRTNEWDEKAGWGTHRIMSTEQIRYWSQQGIAFGAHSRTHPDLRTQDDHTLEEEVVGSCEYLAAILGTRPAAFAYPFGEYDQRVRTSVERYFRMAFTTDAGWNTIMTDCLMLRRIVVSPRDGWPGLAVRIWSEPLQRLRDTLRVRSRVTNIVRKIVPGVRSDH
jgi:peptidoglycan/xylan/chitin deacetylase (PgdA/CDA1 family)